MKQEILEYLNVGNANLSTESIIVAFIASVLIGAVIFVSYRFSHSAAVYSAKFNVSLVMLTIVTTLIMSVIGNNVALSLGMVGALSIVRYRTAIKDPRDTAYIFWAIAAGICCGVQDFVVVGIGSCVIFLIMLVIGNVASNDRYLVIVRGDLKAADGMRAVVDTFFRGKAKFRVQNTTADMVEIIYEVSEKVLKNTEKREDVTGALYRVEGVESVNIICQNDDINR